MEELEMVAKLTEIDYLAQEVQKARYGVEVQLLRGDPDRVIAERMYNLGARAHKDTRKKVNS